MPNERSSSSSPAQSRTTFSMAPELRALIDGSRDAVRRVIADLRQKAEAAEQLRQAEHRAFMAEQRETMAAMTRAVAERLDAVRDGRDGVDGRDGAPGEQGERGPAGEVGPQGERGPVGERGVDGEAGERGGPGERGEQGPAGEPGERGEAGERGNDGVAGERGETGRPGERGADGVGLASAMIDRDGNLVVTTTTGAILKLGSVVGRDGADGVDGRAGDPGERGEAGAQGETGQAGADGRDAYHGEARGLYDPEAQYRALDVVSFNGSEWRAKQDSPGPLPGEGWMLSASRGKRGDRGEPGQPGRDARAAPTLAATYVDADRLQLVHTLDDGTEIKADLADLIAMLRQA